MSTLIYSVRADEIKQQSLVEQDRRQVHGAVVLVAVAIGPGVFLVEHLVGTVAWRSFLAEALSLCLYAAVAVWYGLRHRPRVAWRVALAVYGMGLGIMGFVDYCAKRGQSVLLVDSPLAGESVLFWIGSLMLCFVPLLGWVVWRYPHEMRQVGLYFGPPRSRLLWYIVGGLGMGLQVCLHFWLTTRAIGMEMDVKPWPYMAWQFFYEMGPQSLPEELFMRGVVFNELYFGRNWNFWIAALATSSLELLSLLVKQDYSTDVIMIVGVIFYTVVSSVASAGLFRWSRNVIPGYINNVFFGVVSMFR